MNLILCCYFSCNHKALHWQLIQLLSHKVMQLGGRDRERERVEGERKRARVERCSNCCFLSERPEGVSLFNANLTHSNCAECQAVSQTV